MAQSLFHSCSLAWRYVHTAPLSVSTKWLIFISEMAATWEPLVAVEKAGGEAQLFDGHWAPPALHFALAAVGRRESKVFIVPLSN